MKVETSVVFRFEAAMLLWAGLGDLRGNWDDFLSDSSRRGSSIKGLRLSPCAKRCDQHGYLRPVYSVAEMQKFIADVKTAIPTAGKTRIMPITLSIDTSIGWRINKFDQTGAPMRH